MAAPTQDLTPAPAPGRESSGSSAERTRREAELRGGGCAVPALPPPAILTIPAVHLGGLGDQEDRSRPGPVIYRSRAPIRAAATRDQVSRDRVSRVLALT